MTVTLIYSLNWGQSIKMKRKPDETTSPVDKDSPKALNNMILI